MVTSNQATALLGRVLVDAAGDKVGTVTEVFIDDQTGHPSWIAVRTGWFGSNDSFVPLNLVDTAEPILRTSCDKATITGAPRHDADQPLSRPDEDTLYSYYGLIGPDTAGPRTAGPGPGVKHAHSGQTPEPDRSGTRSGPERPVSAPGGGTQVDRPRLRKHVVTQRQTVTVPVSHEVARIERIPITDADRDTVQPGNFTEEEYAVVLHAERPVLTTEVVAVERVRLTDDPEIPQETASEVPRKSDL